MDAAKVLIFTIAVWCLLFAVANSCKYHSCHDQSQCADDECCLEIPSFKGRRRRDISYGAPASCKKRGNEGSPCIVQGKGVAPLSNASTYKSYYCPCADELTCKPDGHRIIPIGYTGTCVRESRPCDSDRDCGPLECCLMKNRPIGKRRKRSSSLGTCRPLSKIGEQCYVDHPQMCPRCRFPMLLQCVPTGITDIPLGRIGKCQFSFSWLSTRW